MLDTMNLIDKELQLIEFLNKHSALYEQEKPEISDSEWDTAYFELQDLENTTGVIFPNSPTQMIPYQTVSQLNKVKHSSPMLSLAKTKSYEEAEIFATKKLSFIMGKMDGLTCRLTYENGKLVGAETRGDGEVGEDILHNARAVANIPQVINYKEHLVIDGEIISTKENFEAFARDYKNPRNFASGSIRLLDSMECARRNLSFIAWNVVEGLEENHYSTFDLISLESYGFTVVPNIVYEKEHGNIEDAINHMKNVCEHFGYPIDGCVIKYANKDYYNSLGRTDHHYNGAIAFKFIDELYETSLKKIEWTMGRTGVLTPVAIFEETEIEGTIVSRASLHNVSVMLDVLETPFIGQELKIYKANQIIPQIKSANHHYKEASEFLFMPEKCPVCGGEVELQTLNESTNLVCMNPQCSGKMINQLDHFCGKKGLDIKGLSKATLEKLIEWGWVKSRIDLFLLDLYRSEWIIKAGFGEKSVDKILSAIEISRTCALDKFIASLGIPLIGSVAAKALAKHFGTWQNFIDAVRDGFQFDELPNFGYEMHKAIVKYDYSEILDIVRNYIKFEQNVVSSTEEKLKNMTFCITGKLNSFKNRTELKNLIENNGGKATDSVSSKTTYLINNDKNSTSSKNKKAQSLNIQIITEEEFLQLLGGK